MSAGGIADINTALLALAAGLRPQSYLEIGVRRGRSLAMVASVCPACDIVACDMFIEGYGGMDNPGPELVRSELAPCRLHRRARVRDRRLAQGAAAHSSGQHPDRFFDLITVDGDHTRSGCARRSRDGPAAPEGRRRSRLRRRLESVASRAGRRVDAICSSAIRRIRRSPSPRSGSAWALRSVMPETPTSGRRHRRQRLHRLGAGRAT